MNPQLPQGKTSPIDEFTGQGFFLTQFKTPQLSIFSYYLESQGEVFLIDPTYDVLAYKTLQQKRNAKIKAILLTHYHADYLAGHTQFNVPIQMGPNSSKSTTALPIHQIQDNQTLPLGTITLKIIHTPGHTLQSTCFLLLDSTSKPTCLFTGDTIFLNEIGRPDLAVNQTTTKQDLAKMLFHSINKIKKQIDHSVRIYPAHGSGSACGKKIGQGNYCLLSTQLQNNYALKIDNQQQFVKIILNQMPKAPRYFSHVVQLNKSKQTTKFQDHLKQSNKNLSIDQFKTFIDQGAVIIDTRHDFGGKTVKNAYMMTQNGMIASWTGALIKPQSSILLICKKDSAQDQIQRLFRVGFFNIKGYNGFTLDQWKQQGLPIWQPKCVNGQTMYQAKQKTNLDVRTPQQWKDTGIIQGCKLISLGQIPNRYSELQNVNHLYISCKTGGRARLASSILAQHNIPSIIVVQKFDNFKKIGINIVDYK